MKTVIESVMAKTNPRLYMTLSYLYNRKNIPDFKNPKNLSEKIIRKMLNRDFDKYSDLVDKVKARDFVKQKGLKDILTNLIGVWSEADQIDFDKLPNKFVLKANHGCGYNIICQDKLSLDIPDTVSKLASWLKHKYGHVEYQYKLISPLIFCEEFISDKISHLPIDYKFMCFRGEPHCILVCTDRSVQTKLTAMNLNWINLDYITEYYLQDKPIEKPKNLATMIDCARILSKDFDFVRVDLYDSGEQVYFSEITFTPQAGIMSYFSEKAVMIMGGLMQ